MQIGEEKSGSKKLEELSDEGAVGGAGRSKSCVWVRSPKRITDCEW